MLIIEDNTLSVAIYIYINIYIYIYKYIDMLFFFRPGDHPQHSIAGVPSRGILGHSAQYNSVQNSRARSWRLAANSAPKDIQRTVQMSSHETASRTQDNCSDSRGPGDKKTVAAKRTRVVNDAWTNTSLKAVQCRGQKLNSIN